MNFKYDPRTMRTVLDYGPEELPSCAELIMRIVYSDPSNQGAAEVLKLMLVDLERMKKCTVIPEVQTWQ